MFMANSRSEKFASAEMSARTRQADQSRRCESLRRTPAHRLFKNAIREVAGYSSVLAERLTRLTWEHRCAESSLEDRTRESNIPRIFTPAPAARVPSTQSPAICTATHCTTAHHAIGVSTPRRLNVITSDDTPHNLSTACSNCGKPVCRWIVHCADRSTLSSTTPTHASAGFFPEPITASSRSRSGP